MHSTRMARGSAGECSTSGRSHSWAACPRTGAGVALAPVAGTSGSSRQPVELVSVRGTFTTPVAGTGSRQQLGTLHRNLGTLNHSVPHRHRAKRRAPAAPPAAGSGGEQASPLPAEQAPPWRLMGRMVQEERVGLGAAQRQALIKSAAVQLSGLTVSEFNDRLEQLVLLLPDLRDRLPSLRPELLAELCADVQETARRIIQLRQWLPAANVSQILAERPALLRADDFAALPSALAKLRHMFPEGGVDALVTQQPYLLAEDVDEIVGELERLLRLPRPAALAVLRTDPDIALSVMDNRRLSLWLVPGADVRDLLRSNPEIVFEVQRGTNKLGPGAEEAPVWDRSEYHV